MGCISSKNVRSQEDDSPEPYHRPRVRSHSGSSRTKPRLAAPPSSLLSGLGPLEKIKEEPEEEENDNDDDNDNERSANNTGLDKTSTVSFQKRALFGFRFGRLIEAQHVTAGWPAWLSAVAAEAIDGWLPLRSDTFERLEKVGRGTYSNVYRARHLESGRMYAVKKVRFDYSEPESVRFMAREIHMLRRLDHPNIIKLEGIITSRSSTHVHLVFEYMEHDLAGLLSCPHIKFTHAQIKCYMKQLLSGLEHCHSRGILHRDIKTSNILINNQGILKIADFGLANYMKQKKKTSRVVTLWYRPPELLLGATKYGEGVDIWSVGCVFAELFIGRPVMKGRTEVEQLHKIFKLCGSPHNDEYWNGSRLPMARMFKPQQPYESTLMDRFQELPKSAVALLHTFLSVDPCKRGTAASALHSTYFTTKPWACDPSTLPKYPPSKEIDAKSHDDTRKKTSGAGGGSRNSRRLRKSLQQSSDYLKLIPSQDGSERGQAFYDTVSEAASESTQQSLVSTTRSVPVPMQPYAWPQPQTYMKNNNVKFIYDHHQTQNNNIHPPSRFYNGS